MLERRITGLIELSPHGITNGQLLWRLNSGGVRYDASELSAALERLTATGVVQTDGIRWRSPLRDARLSDAKNAPARAAGTGLSKQPDRLYAVPAMVSAVFLEDNVPADSNDAEEGRFPEPSALLQYYAATQRRDPRGAVEAFPDHHGTKWQLFALRGSWWEGQRISVRAHSLGDGIRQALADAGLKGSAAVGWPILVASDSTGTVCVPGFLMPVSWQLEENTLTLTVERVQPVLNSAFVRYVKRATSVGEDALLRAMQLDEEGVSLQTLTPHFSHLLARLGGAALRPGDLVHEVDLSVGSLRNAAGLFLPDEASFTRRVAEDLDRIAAWSDDMLSGTALGALLKPAQVAVSPDSAVDVLEVGPLAEPQFLAADAALNDPLTTIQGPPGTGKSQTIVSLIVSALVAGQRVVFAARNHRALDEVESRLQALMPGASILIRARDADGQRNTSMLDALQELAQSRVADSRAGSSADVRLQLQDAARDYSTVRRSEVQRNRIGVELAALVDREEELRTAYAEAGAQETPKPGVLWWLLWMLRRLRFLSSPPLSMEARPHEIRLRIAELRRQLDALPDQKDVPSFDSGPLLPALALATALPSEPTVQFLLERKAEISFERGVAKMRHVTAEDARIVLSHRPVWLISTLSLPARVPLEPGLFDLAVFDESSQCDIASALPVLARAKRAVVVGDPEQLTFIPSLGAAQEHALMDAVGLPRQGRGRWAQSRNSLFDFVQGRLEPAHRHFLRDQFRSAPSIVSYSSLHFYGGRLVPQKTDEDFAVPAGYRPGLHWQDVTGPCSREDGGNINRAEADWIVARLTELIAEQAFDGATIGVISPFSAQVGLIRKQLLSLRTKVPDSKVGIIVDTVDGWQGGEADIVFFSLAVGPGAAASAVTFLRRERRRFNVAVSRARAASIVVGNLSWARSCGISHIEGLAEGATRPPVEPQRGFDSKWERRMYEALKSRNLESFPQYRVGRRSLDFALFHGDVKLDLEVDGRKWHTGADGERKVADRFRDRELVSMGWKVRRFWVDELARNMETCLDIVERDLGFRS